MIKRDKLGRWKKGSRTKTVFKKGHVTWNKNKKGIHLSPNSEFKPGQLTMNKHPSWKGGVQNIKKNVIHITVAPNTRARRPRLVWEESHGMKLPKKHIVFHKNGNNHDDRPENLEAITRKELYRRNLIKGRWSKR